MTYATLPVENVRKKAPENLIVRFQVHGVIERGSGEGKAAFVPVRGPELVVPPTRRRIRPHGLLIRMRRLGPLLQFVTVGSRQ
jgi:hypothetical protein